MLSGVETVLGATQASARKRSPPMFPSSVKHTHAHMELPLCIGILYVGAVSSSQRVECFLFEYISLPPQ